MAKAITLLIDGPSGAGKTWLAEHLRHSWPAGRSVQILHMDDLYQGWQGLNEASSYIANCLISKRAQGLPIVWQRWDWASMSLAEQHQISADVDLIVEGCGSLTASSAKCADLSIWINADDQWRKTRALGRGGEDFDNHWYEWDLQFQQHTQIHNPQAHASLVVRATQVD